MPIYKLCMCNKCGGIFDDTNPQTGQREYEIPIDITAEPLIDHSCPDCKTDEYLMDFEAELCESDYRLFGCGKENNKPIY